MPQDQTIEDLLARLERERLAADRLYNEALSAVDRALQAVPPLPKLPAAYDARGLAALRDATNILPGGAPPIDGSFKGRLRGLVWRMVGPSIEAQRHFNALLVDHLQRNAVSHEETTQAVAALLPTLKRELEALVRFESLLVQMLQTITGYVDSKDRSLGGADLRERLALTEQKLLALKREVESAPAQAGAHVPSAGAHGPAAAAAAPFGGAVDSVTYVGFEDRFRGSEDEIERRVRDYVPLLASGSDILDVGCGRGELLALLKAQGVAARGIDVNAAMVERCRSRGLMAEQGDALSFLKRQPDGSIGGLVAVQVVEHFEPAYLVKFLEAAFHAMRPGAPLVLETINPACWVAFFEAYLRDPTHKQAIHPETLKYLVQAAGFSDVDVAFKAPVREADRLDRVEPSGAQGTGSAAELVAAINAHADKLNRLLFSAQDYAVIARR